VVMTLLLLGRLVAWVPIGALAGILLVISWRMFDWSSMSRLLRYPAGRLDFAVIAGVILVAITVDLITASGVGIALAILCLFGIRLGVRSSAGRGAWTKCLQRPAVLMRNERYSDSMATERSSVSCRAICFLARPISFFSQLEADLRTKRFILLDMRRVQSMDYTAAHLFEQMQAQLEERGGRLLFTGMPSALLDQRDFERYLAQLGVVREGGGIMISETLDGALEWMEERILEASNMVKKRWRKTARTEGLRTVSPIR